MEQYQTPWWARTAVSFSCVTQREGQTAHWLLGTQVLLTAYVQQSGPESQGIRKHLQTCARCFLLRSPKFHRKNVLLGPWNDFEVASGWSLVEGAAQGRDRGIHMCCCVISSHRLPPVGISRDPPVQSSSTLLHLGPFLAPHSST